MQEMMKPFGGTVKAIRAPHIIGDDEDELQKNVEDDEEDDDENENEDQ